MVGSYNIVAECFDAKGHPWAVRAPYVKKALIKHNFDILALQELSPGQALDITRWFPNHRLFVLCQTPSDVPAGAIVEGEAISAWAGKHTGATLNGILVRAEYLVPDILTCLDASKETSEKTGRFWLNESPFEVPIPANCRTLDKGFGNMNTYRAVLWVKLRVNGKILYVFCSHYPLSGGE